LKNLDFSFKKTNEKLTICSPKCT